MKNASENLDEGNLYANELGKLIASLRNDMMAKLDDALKPYDLTASQYVAIKFIAERKADTLARLCDLMQHDKGAMSRMLNRMENKELIVRKPCPDDGRAFKLGLSEKGKALFPDTMPVVHSIFAQAMQGFSESKQKEFFSMLIQCRANLS